MTRASFSPHDSRIRLADGSGRPLALGRELARGGEGAVFEVLSRPDLVAKLYGRPVSPQKAEKLRLMATHGPNSLRTVAAWPVDVLSDPRTTAVLGFLMPRIVEAAEIHQLFSPAERKRSFPDLTFKMLVTVARNAAAAVDEVHKAGHVIGDVNQKGFLVRASSARVTLIDCDSFQIQAGNEIHRCGVGVAEFTPPELMGARFSEIDRLPAHDVFGLAVLIFQLLFMGRHPYAGRLLSGEDGTLERAIREHRFAYGSGARDRGISPAPGTFGLELVPASIGSLFEACFSPSSVLQGRPVARQWVTALDGFLGRIQKCSRNPRHEYFDEMVGCPWCLSEARGVVFFLRRFIAEGEQAVADIRKRLDALYQTLLDPFAPVPKVPMGPPIKPVIPSLVSRALYVRRALDPDKVGCLFLVICIGILVATRSFAVTIACALTPVSVYLAAQVPILRYRDQLVQGRAAVQRRLDPLTSAVTSSSNFGTISPLIKRIEAGLDQRKKVAESGRQKVDLAGKMIIEERLAAFLLSRAGLPGIGASRLAMLRSFGIETAADITENALGNIPGIGPKRKALLLGWRHTLERRCQASLPADRLEKLKRQAEQACQDELLRLDRGLYLDLETAEALATKAGSHLQPMLAEIRQNRRQLTGLLITLQELG